MVVEKVVKTEENKNEPDEETTYKIEIPANRYDLLCVEGLGRAIAVYLGKYAFLIRIFRNYLFFLDKIFFLELKHQFINCLRQHQTILLK